MAEEPIFDGYIKQFSEKPGGLKVDDFYGRTVDYYFISHAHSDHFKGLREFQDILRDRSNNTVIYCTEETGKLIMSMDGFDREILVNKFRYKAVGEIFSLRYRDGVSNTTVQFVPANHIPGAVMMLFEDDRYKALYTGDFRFESYERSSEVTDEMKNFLENTTDIDFLYLDVQFLDLLRERDEHLYPGKRVILQELVNMVSYQTGYGQRFDNVHVDCSSLGWQEVAAHLADEFDSPVGIWPWDNRKELHECILELLSDNTCINTPNDSFVHIFRGPDCQYCSDSTLRIKPSVQWSFYSEEGQGYSFEDRNTWIQEKDPEEDPGFFNVLFSFHCSDYELHEFMKLVNLSRRAEIYPINRPYGENIIEMSGDEITDKLRRLFGKYYRGHQDSSSPSKRRRY